MMMAMMMRLSAFLVIGLSLLQISAAFLNSNSVLPSNVARVSKVMMQGEGPISRQTLLQEGVKVLSVTAAANLMFPLVSNAEPEEVARVTTRMGGTMEPYSDINKGFKLFRPSGWDAFSNAPEEYDVKFVDLVNKQETITVSTTPVKSSTAITALGPVQAVGEKLAGSRKADLLSAKEKITEGVVSYTYEFKKGNSYEVYQLSINKGKLW
eukprot:CAMPEP_0117743638 /NCGR_PEP_ID=MMETSP0947-20121206/6263_1 /TAXON_ID=44440 /ORGANISM="Chattonella subsalsa, Strain CCMP2191" /LENGTH=209 /DNA_ID=CAMNT_0005560395 /DNA_START=105 /DNA_END=731 /DNA_ORIENTATION=-